MEARTQTEAHIRRCMRWNRYLHRKALKRRSFRSEIRISAAVLPVMAAAKREAAYLRMQ